MHWFLFFYDSAAHTCDNLLWDCLNFCIWLFSVFPLFLCFSGFLRVAPSASTKPLFLPSTSNPPPNVDYKALYPWASVELLAETSTLTSSEYVRKHWNKDPDWKGCDENQLKVAFYNEEQDHSPSHLKFFLLIFAKDKAQAQEGQSPQKPKDHPMKGKAKF